ncbi:MAG: hypothetical protein WDW38_001565 [Sanguina aurantia]
MASIPSSPELDDEGGYAVWDLRVLSACTDYVTLSCVSAQGAAQCLSDATALVRARKALQAAGSQSAGPSIRVLVLPALFGGLLVLASAGFLLFRCKRQHSLPEKPLPVSPYAGILRKMMTATNLRDVNGYLDAVPDIRIDGLLGRGGFGEVYKGTLNGLDVAIKMIPHFSNTADSILREVNLIRGLHHPNMVKALYWVTMVLPHAKGTSSFQGSNVTSSRPTLPDVRASLRLKHTGSTSTPDLRPHSSITTSPNLERLSIDSMDICHAPTMLDIVHASAGEPCETWVFQELCEGGSLAVWLRCQQIVPCASTYGFLVRLAADAARGLAFLHSFSLCHGDLKLDNVLLSFAAASASQQPSARPPSSRDPAHSSADCSGRSAPTHAGGLRLGMECWVRSPDVYSLGLLIWEVVEGGAVPHKGMSHAEIVYRVAHSDLRPKFSPTVPQPLIDIACACWVTDPALRPSAAAVLKRLEALLEGPPLTPAGPRTSQSQTEVQGITPSECHLHMASMRVPSVIAGDSSGV